MTLQVQQLLRVSLTVADLSQAAAFYCRALGFSAEAPADADPAMARLLGAARVRTMRIHRGSESLELAQFEPAGAPYPPGSRSNDLWFQHCALTTDDIGAAYARLRGTGCTAISLDGPRLLPKSSGGVTAFKFRDPEGHPLELIAFPDRPGAPDGIDHSAIAVSDAGRSAAYYAVLGLRIGSRGVNSGSEQDALDGLPGVTVDVVALVPPVAAPHVELLGYRAPPSRAAPPARPADIAASRLVLAATGLEGHPGAVTLQDGSRASLMHDPDGHALLMLQA